jgi:hypothetical protein
VLAHPILIAGAITWLSVLAASGSQVSRQGILPQARSPSCW